MGLRHARASKQGRPNPLLSPVCLWIEATGLGRNADWVVKAIDSRVAVQPSSKFGPAGASCFRLAFIQDPETRPTVVGTLAQTLKNLTV